jgi:hypothetical protein
MTNFRNKLFSGNRQGKATKSSNTANGKATKSSNTANGKATKSSNTANGKAAKSSNTANDSKKSSTHPSFTKPSLQQPPSSISSNTHTHELAFAQRFIKNSGNREKLDKFKESAYCKYILVDASNILRNRSFVKIFVQAIKQHFDVAILKEEIREMINQIESYLKDKDTKFLNFDIIVAFSLFLPELFNKIFPSFGFIIICQADKNFLTQSLNSLTIEIDTNKGGGEADDAILCSLYFTYFANDNALILSADKYTWVKETKTFIRCKFKVKRTINHVNCDDKTIMLDFELIELSNIDFDLNTDDKYKNPILKIEDNHLKPKSTNAQQFQQYQEQFQQQLYQEQLYQEQLCQEQLYQEQLYQEQLYQEQLYQEQLHQEQLHQEQLYQEQLYQDQQYRYIDTCYKCKSFGELTAFSVCHRCAQFYANSILY